MNVSRQFLERIAGETGFRPGTLEKVVRLADLAGDIARHPLLGSVLALKGGTALNLAFGPPSRLSVDLDFNYIGHHDRGAMLAERPQVEKSIADLARRKGYRVQVSADAFAGRKIYLSYSSVLGQADRIEVDLNFLFRVPVGEPEMRELWQPGGLDRPRLRVVSLHEIGVGKLLALLDRTAARDAWDAARLPLLGPSVLLDPSFRARLITLSAILDHPLESYTRVRLFERITHRSVEELLVPMLMEGEAPRAEVLADQAWRVIEPLLDLDPAEREFTLAIQKGEVRMDLLFANDPTEAERMAGHPAIQWKLLNARKRKG